ncbi:family 43 glycosylhydrolase [Skermania sp. ID1734]|uniref:family 43 glycosylhydrolase n=1 Tax=Skermania sp. ID1734 TaxID=2597516 RepID=UPI002102132F|nr:family 43 glycosylhydrolase [Skermania sp. ID1734]
MRTRSATAQRWVLSAITVCAIAAVAAPAHANPVVQPVAADPSVIRAADGKFYMYTTGDDWGDGHGTHDMSIFTSDDLESWKYSGDVFKNHPSWHPAGKVGWAPDAHYKNGQYSLYYALGDPTNPCIGLATAQAPTGPWTDLGKAVLCAKDVGVEGTIDPFVWDDGTSKTMIVGNFHGIYAIPLDAAGHAPAGKPVQIADKRFEAPYVQFHDGYYYLFVSAGNCCRDANTAYRVLVGRSSSLTGPYVDRKGTDLNNGGGALVLAGSDKWAGPGHNSIITDDAGTDWIVYHAIPRARLELPSGAQRREGMIDRITWADGWPEVGDGSPSSTGPEVPKITSPVKVSVVSDDAQLPASGGTVKAALRITAPADAAYSGKVWANYTLPSSTKEATLLQPQDVALQPGQSVDRPITFTVDSNASPGTYELIGYAGPSSDQPVQFGALMAQKATSVANKQ